VSPPAITVQGLGKRYRFGYRRPSGTLRDLIAGAFRGPSRRGVSQAGGATPPPDEEWFWALRDVSFEVQSGKVLGVIGGNGAGKSTLLKILSRITEPTEGQAVIRGRVGSLLEVGTGFHSELTGRENIYLSGAILGMTRAEIARRFDEIVEFSEIGRFLDMPVKHYSSGMQMRLAFAVAAHLEPEILLVDEVLAVGDAAFQRKCIGKMSDVAGEGRTILFVSHNMAAVQALCSWAVWLREGRIVDAGPPGRVVGAYLQTASVSRTERTWPDPTTAPGNDRLRLRRAQVRPADGAEAGVITTRTPVLLEFEYWSLAPGPRPWLSLNVINQEGTLLFNAGPPPADRSQRGGSVPGVFRDVCRVPGDLLNDGTHRVEVYLIDGEEVVYALEDVLAFDVHDSPDLRGSWFGKWIGAVRPALEWQSERIESAETEAPPQP
jgi:lipopolysaccharide transport system ATP-binding protein